MRYHHEQRDGHGYLLGLHGEEIPLMARITAIADVFDALTHERPYKPAWELDRALEEIAAGSGSAFDPRVVQAFATLDAYELIREPDHPGTIAHAALQAGRSVCRSTRAASGTMTEAFRSRDVASVLGRR